ncbi:metallophosphoesterase [Cerasicoccus maritimus]|uniref:metallophosphoesterase n=1 Tax=Cerasicoccus maritimus TaxID=490089 RepID=UPI0028528697|nr:metallophosphoesterase [Cerasicoccus maritimus]
MIRVAGLRARGRHNFQNIELVTRELKIPRLPTEFDGFRLLHMADLHLDLCPELLTPAVLRTLEQADFDLCINTGDFVLWHKGWPLALAEFTRIAEAIHSPHFGVLGNHDSVAHVADLEATGLHLLMNEATPIRRGDAEIWLAGVDDPHYFKSCDLEHALVKVPGGDVASRAVTLLLAHAPVYGDEAAASGRVDAMFCGHTHGGQLCLPGGAPIVTHSDGARDRVKGPWRAGAVQGYTSRGIGCSGVAARFNCRPEITCHILRKG